MISQKPVVLVVEDDAMIRIGALDLVESAGCVAVEAKDADEAIRILESRPDILLVFTDIDMPGSMDGMKLSHYVRNRWPPIHIIVASGKAISPRATSPPARGSSQNPTRTAPSSKPSRRSSAAPGNRNRVWPVAPICTSSAIATPAINPHPRHWPRCTAKCPRRHLQPCRVLQ